MEVVDCLGSFVVVPTAAQIIYETIKNAYFSTCRYYVCFWKTKYLKLKSSNC